MDITYIVQHTDWIGGLISCDNGIILKKIFVKPRPSIDVT